VITATALPVRIHAAGDYGPSTNLNFLVSAAGVQHPYEAPRNRKPSSGVENPRSASAAGLLRVDQSSRFENLRFTVTMEARRRMKPAAPS